MELRVEVVEYLHLLSQKFVGADQCCDSEMVGTVALLKATSRHQYNTSVVEHLHAVEQVWPSL